MPAPSERPIVFVVGDDALVRDTVEDLLTSVGLEVRLFASAAEFVETRRADARVLAELRRRFAALSPREQDVMRQVVNGRLNKQIAGDLNLSEARVKALRGQIMRKMQAESLPELVRIADRLGIETTARPAARPK